MRRLGIYTRDFRFYHEILKILKNWDLPFVSITESMEIPKDVAVIISSNDDQSISGEQLRCSDPLSAVRKGISFLIGKDRFNGVVIGIDPGPKPGFAVMADGILVEAFECAALIDHLFSQPFQIQAHKRTEHVKGLRFLILICIRNL